MPFYVQKGGDKTDSGETETKGERERERREREREREREKERWEKTTVKAHKH